MSYELTSRPESQILPLRGVRPERSGGVFERTPTVSLHSTPPSREEFMFGLAAVEKELINNSH